MAHWIRFTPAGEATGFGALKQDRIEEYAGDLFGPKQPTGRTLALDAVRVESPCQPTKVVALWNNFRALGEKLGKAAPAHPLYLLKPASSVIGTGAAIRRPPAYAGKIAYEGELGIVIGRRCTDASADEAEACIFGYTCINDVTATELLNENPDFPQWTRSKSPDTFCCVGPAIATAIDLASGRVVTTLDGTERQNYPLADMIFTPRELVSRISQDMTLLPGDVIACGTSIGVGSMKDGATVCIRIDGIGELRNRLGG